MFSRWLSQTTKPQRLLIGVMVYLATMIATIAAIVLYATQP